MKKLIYSILSFVTLFALAEQAGASSYMPLSGNDYASEVDSLYLFLLIASFVSFVLVIGGMIYFVLKYKRVTDNDSTPYISHNNTLEFLWSFIPFLIFLFVFAWGWKLFHQAKTPPENAFELHVTGRQWAWDFEYKSGRKSTTEFYVPVGKPIKLLMTSSDVIHSFYLPAFRIKQDVVPGMYTTLWVEPKKEGEYQVFCTEYCGNDHSRMLGTMKVVSQEAFEKWLEDDPAKAYEGMSLAERGAKIVQQKGCVACHSFTEKKVLVGPSLFGVFGEERTLTDGSVVTMDENYIRKSIKEPAAQKPVGFDNGVMSLIPMSDDEVMWVIEYLKSTTK